MSEKSYNSARAVGILPHHNMKPLPIGAIPDYAIIKIITLTSEDSTKTVYIVPTNKIFYLASVSISVINRTGEPRSYSSCLYDSSDNCIYKFCYSRIRDDEPVNCYFQPAILMPLNEGEYIEQSSDQVNLLISTSIFGYEVG